MRLIQVKREDNPILLLCGLYLVTMLVILIVANVTGDEGDSLTHNFYAKNAW